MKQTLIASILTEAKKNKEHGNLCTIEGCCGSFDFDDYDCNSEQDNWTIDEESNCLVLSGSGCTGYYDCDTIAHIDVYHNINE